MKEKRTGKTVKKAKGARPARVSARQVILLDGGPIRAAALRVYRELEEQLGGLRQTLESYETGDLPAYRRWEAVTLGPLLSELRALTQELEEKRELMDAIAEEQAWSGCSAVAAYRRVLREMEDEGQEEPEADPQEEDSGPARGADGEEDRPKLFGDSDLPEGLTAEKFDRMRPGEQASLRASFRQMAALYEALTGYAAPDLDELLEAQRAESLGDTYTPRDRGARSQAAPSARPAPGKEQSRLKELYRRLVRELHPDVNEGQTAREREFWHQVQDAYQAGDLARLEALAGRVDIGLVGNADHLPVQVLLRMAQDLRDSMDGMIRQLRIAKDHPAWNFRRKGAALAKFATKRRRELSVGLEATRAEVNYLRAQLESLATKAGKTAKKRAAGKRARARTFSGEQADFGF